MIARFLGARDQTRPVEPGRSWRRREDLGITDVLVVRPIRCHDGVVVGGEGPSSSAATAVRSARIVFTGNTLGIWNGNP